MGFFPLAFSIPLLQSGFRHVLFKMLILTALGVLILLLLSLSLHIITIDLKFPSITPIYLIANLFFVTIPEEAFFRGFLQRELEGYLQTKWAAPFSIFAVSLLFVIMHFGFIRDFQFLLLSFIASLIYGTIYSLTRAIESSIFCHFLFNIIHFFFFTYPAAIQT
jgi:membrane protease YdiL (CAAX protease family)